MATKNIEPLDTVALLEDVSARSFKLNLPGIFRRLKNYFAEEE